MSAHNKSGGAATNGCVGYTVINAGNQYPGGAGGGGCAYSHNLGSLSGNSSSDWRPISEAPRDGTVIETKCSYGVAPWYGLHKWVEYGNNVYVSDGSKGRWEDANDPQKGVGEGPSLTWRPYSGGGSYVDPTGGAQNTQNYWLQACGMKPVKDGDEPLDKPTMKTAATARDKLEADSRRRFMEERGEMPVALPSWGFRRLLGLLCAVGVFYAVVWIIGRSALHAMGWM